MNITNEAAFQGVVLEIHHRNPSRCYSIVDALWVDPNNNEDGDNQVVGDHDLYACHVFNELDILVAYYEAPEPRVCSWMSSRRAIRQELEAQGVIELED